MADSRKVREENEALIQAIKVKDKMLEDQNGSIRTLKQEITSKVLIF
jgi:hypothetical protein